MGNKINRKEALISLFLIPVVLVVGIAIASQYHPLKASEKETNIVSVGGESKTNQHQATVTDTTENEDEIVIERSDASVQEREIKANPKSRSAVTNGIELSASIRDEDIVDGTEVWDAHDEPGYDSGPSNGIIRSFDTIKYPIQLVLSAAEENTEIAKNIELKITGKLTNGFYKERIQAVFDPKWGANEDPLNEGEVTFEYFHLVEEAGRGERLWLNVDVQAAFHNVALTLSEVKVEVLSIDGVAPTTQAVVALPDTKSIKTSCRVDFRVSMTSIGGAETLFSDMVVNHDIIAPHKYGGALSVNFYLNSPSGDRGLKGYTIPVGKIKYRLYLEDKSVMWQNRYEGNGEPEKPLIEDIPITPANNIQLLDYRPVDIAEGDSIQTQHGKGALADVNDLDWQLAGINSPRSSPNSYLTGENHSSRNSAYNSGKLDLINEPTQGQYEFVMSEYKIGDSFPIWNSSSSVLLWQDNIFAVWQYVLIVTNEFQPEALWKPEYTLMSESYQLLLEVDSYEDENGQEIACQTFNRSSISHSREKLDGNHSVKTDVSNTFSLSDLSSYGHTLALPGAQKKVQGQLTQQFSSKGTREALLNWNTDSFEYIAGYNRGTYATLTGNHSLTEEMWSYGIVKEGKLSQGGNFNHLEDLKRADFDDYEWYTTIAEAKVHGQIGALRIRIENEATPKGDTLNWEYYLKVKTRKMGTINEKGTPNIAVAECWVDKTAEGEIIKSGQPVDCPLIYGEDNQIEKGQEPRGTKVRFDTLGVQGIESQVRIWSDKISYQHDERQKFIVGGAYNLLEDSDQDIPLTLTVTIPRGLVVVSDTILYNDELMDPKDFELIENLDRTTTLRYTVNVWEKAVHGFGLLTYEAEVDNSVMPYNGSEASLESIATINSPCLIQNGNDADRFKHKASITTHVTKTDILGIKQKSDFTKIEINGDFMISIIPYTTSDFEKVVTGIWNLPLLEEKSTSDSAETIEISGITNHGNKARQIYLNKQRQEETNPNKIDITKDGWELYEPNASTKEQLKEYQSVYYVFSEALEIFDGERNHIDISLETKGNKPNDCYISTARGNSATDYSTPVSANEARVHVVGRSLSGMVWYDIKPDGLFDNEPLAEGIPVMLYCNDQLLTENLTGEKFVDKNGESLILTDDQGYYEFTQLPAGSYVAEFMIGDQIEKRELKITKALAGEKEDYAINSKVTETRKTPTYQMPGLTDFKDGFDYREQHINLGLLEPTAGIRLFKYEAGSGEDLDGDGEISDVEIEKTSTPLTGAKFALYEGHNVDGEPIDRQTTEKGYSLFEGLFPGGEYTLVETEAPFGYELIKNPIQVMITDSYQMIQVYQDDPKMTELPFTGGTNPTQLVLMSAVGISIIGMGYLGYIYLQPKIRKVK